MSSVWQKYFQNLTFNIMRKVKFEGFLWVFTIIRPVREQNLHNRRKQDEDGFRDIRRQAVLVLRREDGRNIHLLYRIGTKYR